MSFKVSPYLTKYWRGLHPVWRAEEPTRACPTAAPLPVEHEGVDTGTSRAGSLLESGQGVCRAVEPCDPKERPFGRYLPTAVPFNLDGTNTEVACQTQLAPHTFGLSERSGFGYCLRFFFLFVLSLSALGLSLSTHVFGVPRDLVCPQNLLSSTPREHR